MFKVWFYAGGKRALSGICAKLCQLCTFKKSKMFIRQFYSIHSNLINDNDLEVETILHGLERFKRIISLAEHKHFPDFKANEGEEEGLCNLTFQ